MKTENKVFFNDELLKKHNYKRGTLKSIIKFELEEIQKLHKLALDYSKKTYLNQKDFYIINKILENPNYVGTSSEFAKIALTSTASLIRFVEQKLNLTWSYFEMIWNNNL